MPRALRALLVIAAAAAAASACSGEEHRDGAPGDGGDGEGGGDGPSGTTDAEVDGEPPAAAGPLTMVTTDLLLSSEYVCDHDGDGLPDNSVGDLLQPAADLLAMALSSVVQSGIDGGRLRLIVHFPWVDDLSTMSDQSATALVFDAKDLDVPSEPADDFSGNEPFAVFWRYLDPCGEPISWVPEVRLDAGEVHGQNGLVPIVLGDGAANAEVILAREAMLLGSVAPDGRTADFTICGYAVPSDLGRVPGPMESGDLSLLEVLLAGGELFAIPGVPGLDADIDVDGDGLETFTLDAEWRLESCIDGDRSVIEGRDCWRDERMADGFSVTFVLSTVPAVFGGRQRDWADEVEGTCEEPPETSLFDPA